MKVMSFHTIILGEDAKDGHGPFKHSNVQVWPEKSSTTSILEPSKQKLKIERPFHISLTEGRCTLRRHFNNISKLPQSLQTLSRKNKTKRNAIQA